MFWKTKKFEHTVIMIIVLVMMLIVLGSYTCKPVADKSNVLLRDDSSSYIVHADIGSE